MDGQAAAVGAWGGGRMSESTPGDLVPATSIQQRMWFAERLEPGTGVYNVPLAWRVHGTLAADTLAAALALVVERHEILRTSFVERDGRLYQVVGEPWTPELEHLDLRGAPDAEDRLAAWMHDAGLRGFDLTTDRLLRVALVELADEQVLFVCTHHLVWDASSMPVFLRDLRAGYEAAGQDAGGGPESWRELDLTSLDAERLRVVGRRMLDWLAPRASAELGVGECAASAHQERMAFIDRFEKGVVYETSPTYHNLPLVLRVPAVPDRVALDAALATVVGRHEALRTNLVFAADDSVRQRVCAEREVRAEWLPATEPGDGLIGWLRTPFDLEHDSLFRVAVQPLEDGTAWLALLGHQAVVDRVSLAVVAEELLDGTVGEPSSYRDWLAGADPDVVATDLAVQAAVLGGEIEPIALPEREARAAVHVYQERSVPVVLPAGLDAAAARLAVPVDALLLAAFHAVLAAYTGQYELVIGTVQSRRGPGEERVLGPLANLVPVRLNSAPEQDFGSFATVAAGDLARAARHCRAQFDDLVRVLNPAKDMSRTALFDVLFHYAPEPPRPDESGWVGGYGRYDFQLLLRPDGDGVSGRIVYNGLYFGDDQLTLFAEHYTRVVEQAISDPDTTISGFDLLTDRERHTQLLDWNTSAAYPETTIHNLVAAKAREFPDRVALTAGSQHRTYDELVGNAERIARGLVARGVQPGELVALVLERGVAQVEAILGVIAAGAAYLPIAPANPAERIAFILADSETRWVITDGEGPAGDATVLSIPELIAADHDVALPEVAPDDLAYCIYTSGTTGRPKGALITHRNLVRLVRNDDFPFEVSAADVWTMFHSYSFDFSVWEIFGGLALHGGRLVVVADDVAADPQRFLDLLRRERVTVLNQTPTAFGRLTNLAQADGERADWTALRYVMFGGEALAPGKLAGWCAGCPAPRLVNMYGITETTVLTTAHEVTRADIDGDVSIIGMPMPGPTPPTCSTGTTRAGCCRSARSARSTSAATGVAPAT